jgi:hypothetical protein
LRNADRSWGNVSQIVSLLPLYFFSYESFFGVSRSLAGETPNPIYFSYQGGATAWLSAFYDTLAGLEVVSVSQYYTIK